MIEQKEIDRVKLTPIEEVAERLGMHVEKHKCHCAFHEDRRPSLTFNTYKNRYRCYVCDAHGGVIDLVMHVKRCDFKEAVRWLRGTERMEPPMGISQMVSTANKQTVYPPDLEWLSSLVRIKTLNEPARRFLYEERKIDPRVVSWCGLTSIAQDTPCWKYGKNFYDGPSLLIPYYDIDGRLMSVQSRYLGGDKYNKNSLRPNITNIAANAKENVWSDDGRTPIVLPDSSQPNSLDKQASQPVIQSSIRSETEPSSSAQTENCSSLQSEHKIASHKMEPAVGRGEPSTAPGKDVPRFRFPRGSNCHVYNLQILKMLAPGEPLFITEGCSDCWAMLSAGHKAIAIPSATLLKDKDIEPLRGLNLHMYPDQDEPGERLFQELKVRLPQLVRHQLPSDCKDFGEYWKTIR